MKNFIQKFAGLFILIIISIVIAQINLESGVAIAMALPVGFGPLSWPCGSENMGGFKNRVLFVPDCAVSAVPALPEVITDATDLVTAAGSFTFKSAGDTPVLIVATDKTVKLDAENQGETDGQSFRQSGELFFPGSMIEAAALARKINNTPGYLIVEDPNGTQYMVGSKGMPCSIKPSFTGGAARADRKGFLFTFEADSFCPFVALGTPIDIDAIENPVGP